MIDPNCKEKAHWYILQQKQGISTSQLKKLRLLGNHFNNQDSDVVQSRSVYAHPGLLSDSVSVWDFILFFFVS